MKESAASQRPPENGKSGREPIAIIGIGCRFPGVGNVEEFWDVLAEGRQTIGEYPGRRFPYIDEVYAQGSQFADRIATSRGGFLQDLDQFDADFFGISPREAALLDPQHRLFLEVAWEAIDDAGLPREQLAASRTGVFAGVWTSDYEDCLYEYSPDVDFHATTGSGRYGTSGRLAYILDLRGPNLTVDTACSSSLVAIHLACQSLLTGESSIAIAGGVNAILRPEITLVYSGAGMLAPDGRCKFGDASADGYVRSEGAGDVVLKRLSQALADRDPIYAVIRGSAVNNDGHSSGLLVSPSRAGQEDVIRTAIESAGMTPELIDYVEAHGTGTLAGDPVEIETIGRVMTSETRTTRCAIGSVKTNIGHTESAAGVAGVAKVALALQRGILPASLNLETPNPQIDWNALQVTIPTRSAPWPEAGRPPVAGVSGFGITGTNAHIVLQAAPPTTLAPTSSPKTLGTDETPEPLFFCLSAQTSDALSALAKSWRERLGNDLQWPASLEDLAYTSAIRRTQHQCRLTIAASSRDQLEMRLTDWLEGEQQPGVASGERNAQIPRKAVFIYPGQGGQWVGMGRSLYECSLTFRNALDRCDQTIRAHTGWSVVEILRNSEDARLQDIDVVQPTLFALMIALTDLWRSLGVEPAAVVGHSMGEAAAAVVAGALSLEDGAAVICHRSRLMKRIRGKGAMAVVELSLDDTRAAIKGISGIWIGASNGATSSVISGDSDAVDALLNTLEAREIFCRRIQVDVASHSGHMDEVRGELESVLAHVQPKKSEIPIYSTTTGAIEDGTHLNATYWGKNLRQPVLFHPAIQQLLNDAFDTFIEVNAHPVLTHAIAETIAQAGSDAIVTGTLRRESDDRLEILGAFGRLHVAGYPVNLRHVVPEGNCIRLPAYPWQRERHWFEPPAHAIPLSQRLQSSGQQSLPGQTSNRIHSEVSQTTDPAECLYELEWIDAPIQVKPKEPSPSGHWLVLSGEQRGDGLAAALRARGQRCTLVCAGKEFRDVDKHLVEIDPSSDEDWRRLLRGQTEPIHGIVHAWSLQDTPDAPNIDAIWAAQTRGTFSATRLVRAIAELGSVRPPHLWLVTHGTHAVGNEPVTAPWDAALLGFGRVVAAEHAEMPCTNLDLSATPSDAELQFAAQLMVNGATEQQIAVRGLRQLHARYRRAVPKENTVPAIRADATYLITGGLGGIGLHTAQWLVARGAQHLVLAGRRGPSAETSTVLDQLKAAGAQVLVYSADIADPVQVKQLIEATASQMPPLAGVFHMAVVVDHALVREATEESFRRVFSPKMIGAWNLFEALRDKTIDWCVFFSSMVDVLPQPRSASYAAANAFLDSLARYGKAHGVATQSIQWEPWAGTGLMNEGKTRGALRMYEAQGVRPMSPELGFRILEQALGVSAPVLLAASVDWKTYAAECSADPGASEFLHLASELSPSGVRPTSGNGASSPHNGNGALAAVADMRETLAALPAGRPRLGALELHLRDQLASVLKTAPERMDLQKPMGNMGVDSLLALEFVRRLSRTLGIKVPATVVFNYPTIKKLAVLLESRMEFANTTRDTTPNAKGTPASSASSTLSGATADAPPARGESQTNTDLDDMSDLDAIRALSGKQR